jgi:hypothetical protein
VLVKRVTPVLISFADSKQSVETILPYCGTNLSVDVMYEMKSISGKM